MSSNVTIVDDLGFCVRTGEISAVGLLEKKTKNNEENFCFDVYLRAVNRPIKLTYLVYEMAKVFRRRLVEQMTEGIV